MSGVARSISRAAASGPFGATSTRKHTKPPLPDTYARRQRTYRSSRTFSGASRSAHSVTRLSLTGFSWFSYRNTSIHGPSRRAAVSRRTAVPCVRRRVRTRSARRDMPAASNHSSSVWKAPVPRSSVTWNASHDWRHEEEGSRRPPGTTSGLPPTGLRAMRKVACSPDAPAWKRQRT
ncbi:MAG: hypothetical protein FJ087_04035 [Deltaproteobacteria bacterium]|nr:hypothetical protein [Deltaproteobacteria bacterium]